MCFTSLGEWQTMLCAFCVMIMMKQGFMCFVIANLFYLLGWAYTKPYITTFFEDGLEDWLYQNSLCHTNVLGVDKWSTLFTFIMSAIWKAQNDLVFNETLFERHKVIHEAKSCLVGGETLINKSSQHDRFVESQLCYLSWEPSQEGWVKASTYRYVQLSGLRVSWL